MKKDAGNFLFLNCATGKARYRIAPSKRRLRLHRQKLRTILTDGLNIQEGKKFERAEVLEDGRVRAHFQDDTFADGTILIGADGNNSNVRRYLMPDTAALTPLPVHLVGVIRHFTADQGEAIRAIDPLLFQGLHPETGNYLWYSVQEVQEEADGRLSYDALVIISWLAKDANSGDVVGPAGEVAADDKIPATNCERIAMMKRRAAEFTEPLRSIVADIPDDLDKTTPLRLGDFPTCSWDNRNGRITLAGDSAHAMTMYRGEGANHGIVDAALLVDQLKRIHSGVISQEAAIDEYEAEMQSRTHEAVMKSRAAAIVAHQWDKLTDESPVVAARSPPPSAFQSPFV